MRLIDTMTESDIRVMRDKGMLPRTGPLPPAEELSRTESACAWFDSLPAWACVICGNDAETCEHYEEAEQ